MSFVEVKSHWVVTKTSLDHGELSFFKTVIQERKFKVYQSTVEHRQFFHWVEDVNNLSIETDSTKSVKVSCSWKGG